MKICKLTDQHLERLLELYAQLHPSDPTPGAADVLHAWQQLQQTRGVACYGAFLDTLLVATCTLVIVPNLTRGCRCYGVMENVVTDEQYRARGFGGALLRHALAAAWEQGCYKVMLMTGRKDQSVTRFYQGVGFDSNEKNAFVARPPS
jgi:GNAT superfamily N-acetyltransferase